MKVLILEDESARVEAFRGLFPELEVTHVATPWAFAKALEEGHWDFLIMDHDLGLTSPGRFAGEPEPNGAMAAGFVQPEQGPVLVWSVNPTGAQRMAAVLHGNGVSVVLCPVCSDRFEQTVQGFIQFANERGR